MSFPDTDVFKALSVYMAVPYVPGIEGILP